MNEQIRKFLNEEQDPKAVEKITSKLQDLLMKGEEIGYIGVQKKPVTVFPDSLVLTNKRILVCKPKNLGLSMDFTDYTWDEISGVFVKENILGSEFSFNTKTDMNVSMDYIPKSQARRIYTFAKEQLDLFKNGIVAEDSIQQPIADVQEAEFIEEVEPEEVTHFAEIIPAQIPSFSQEEIIEETVVPEIQNDENSSEKPLSELSKDELFSKLQSYKKLLDNGLILQGEYDALKNEIIRYL